MLERRSVYEEEEIYEEEIIKKSFRLLWQIKKEWTRRNNGFHICEGWNHRVDRKETAGKIGFKESVRIHL